MRARHRLALVTAGAFCLIASVYVTATRQSAVEARLRGALADVLRAPCTFESATFTFLAGLDVRGLRVLDPEDPLRPPLVAVDEARIDFNLDLLGRGPHVTIVHLRSPLVRLTSTSDGRVALAAITAPAEPGTPAPELPILRVTDGTVVLDGPPVLPAGDTLTLSSIRADLLSDGDRLRVPAGHARGTGLGSLEFSLDASRDTSDVTGTLRLHDLDVARYAEQGRVAAVTEALRLHGIEGTARAEISARLTDGVVTALDADLRVDDAAVRLAIPDGPAGSTPEPVTVRLARLHVLLRDGRATIEEARGTAFDAALEVRGHAELGRPLGLPAAPEPALDITLDLQDAHVGAHLNPCLPRHLRRVQEAFSLAGRTDAEIRVHGSLARPQADAHLDVRGAEASYVGYPDPESGARRGFPWRAEGVDGVVEVRGPRVVFRGVGRHGDASVEVEGLHDSTPQGPLTEVRIDVRDVPIDDDLRRAFGDRAEGTLDPWRPEGVAGRVEVLVEEHPGVAAGKARTGVTVVLDGRAAFTPHVLPARLSGAEGTLRILEPVIAGRRTTRIELEDLRAAGDGFVLAAADGAVVGADEELVVELEIERLEGPFREAVLGSSTLSEGTKRAVRLLRPSGAATITAEVRRAGGERDDAVTMTLEGATVDGWEGVPFGLRELQGTIRYRGDAIRTDELRGLAFDDTRVVAEGVLDALSSAEPEPTIFVRAKDVPLDGRLLDALGVLAEPARGVWEELSPDRDLRADADVFVGWPRESEEPLAFSLRNLRGGLRVLGLPVRADGGEVTVATGEGSVHAQSLGLALGSGRIDVHVLDMDLGSGDLSANLAARGLAFPGALVPLLPREAADAVADAVGPALLHLPQITVAWNAASRRLEAAGSAALRATADEADARGLQVRTRLELPEVVAMFPEDGPVSVRGTARMEETSLVPGLEITGLSGDAAFAGPLGGGSAPFEFDLTGARGRVAGLLIEDLAVRMEIQGPRLRLPTITGSIYGGRLTARFNRGGERLAYRGAFEARGVDLARYSEEQQIGEQAGLLDLDVRIRNPGGTASELEGVGTAAIAGAEVRIPFITAALDAVDRALLGVAAMEGAFHTGQIAFDVRGSRVLVRELYFEGPSVPLLLGAQLELQEGRGAIDLRDGRLDMVVYPRLRFGVLGIDPTGIFDRIVGLAQFMVRRLRIEGTTRNPRTRWEVIGGDLDDELRPRPRPLGEVRRYGPEPW